MRFQRLLLASMIAATTLATTLPAQARVDIDVSIAPPPPIVETVPPLRPGYIWAPGYWQWNGHRHVWNKGHMVAERHGQHWVAQNWERHGDHWRSHDGHWERN